MAPGVVPATAGILIEEPAGDIRPRNRTGIAVFELVQATAAASVAKGFPFVLRHSIQSLLQPERRIFSGGCVITGWQHGNRFLKMMGRDLAFHGVIAHMR